MGLGKPARIIFWAVILAMIAAGISPACRFIAGSTVQICSVTGLKTIHLTSADPLTTGKDAVKHDKPCPFCLNVSKVKALGIAQPPFTLLPISQRIFLRRYSNLVIFKDHPANFHARGPPA